MEQGWSVQRVLALAPDDGSRRAARAMARPGPWSAVGRSGTLLWGQVQGTGRVPYQVTVDTAAPSLRCTCPSRKHPCKHALALMLRWLGGQVSGGAEAAQPAWAAEDPRRGAEGPAGGQAALSAGRSGLGEDPRRGAEGPAGGQAALSAGRSGLGEALRREAEGPAGGQPDPAGQQSGLGWSEAMAAAQAQARAAAARAGGRAALADPEAAARRVAAREEAMTGGLEDFGRWLADLVQEGLAAARRQPYGYWDGAAARLVDAQLPGLADRVRGAAGLVHTPAVGSFGFGPGAGTGGWVGPLLAELGRWFAAVCAWPRRRLLPDDVAADLRTFLGWARRKDEVAAGPVSTGRWTVVGLRLGGDDRLRSHRTWLVPADGGDPVLLLDFAAVAGDAGLPVAQVLGSVVEATVARYPGSAPARGLLTGDERVVDHATAVPGAGTVGEALDRSAAWVAANPWLVRTPVALRAMTAVVHEGRAWVADPDGLALPLAADADPWRLLAVTGGRPADLHGELEDGRLHPTTVAIDGRLEDLP